MNLSCADNNTDPRQCTPGTPGTCHPNATCTRVTPYVCACNPTSSYRCECNHGYIGDGLNCTGDLQLAITDKRLRYFLSYYLHPNILHEAIPSSGTLFTRKASSCLLTLLCHYGKPRLCINIHHYSPPIGCSITHPAFKLQPHWLKQASEVLVKVQCQVLNR